jgi:CHAT domain-containing protein
LGTARVFLQSMGMSRAQLLGGIREELRRDEQAVLAHLHRLAELLTAEQAKPLLGRSPERIRDFMEQQAQQKDRLAKVIAQMSKESPLYAGLMYPQPCTLEEARACLLVDEVALFFVPGTQASFVILVEARPKAADKSNGMAIFKLPGSAALAEHVAALNDADTLARPARVKALAHETFDALLGPYQERLHGKHLVIVPGGPLCFLPFELLVEDDGKYLIEKHRIRYAPSLTALHHIGLWKQKRVQPEVPLFAVGDPVYEEKDRPAGKQGQLWRQRRLDPHGDLLAAVSLAIPQRDDTPRRDLPTPPRVNGLEKAPAYDARRDLLWREGRPGTFQRLLHSGQEVAEIAKLLGAGPDYVLRGKDASEAKVKAASAADKMAKARYVHFATHGILGLDQGKQPALVLNLVGNTTEDGFLEMDEITSLKLNADLVVLSACRTGQGRMHRGEGVTGLARAFLYAGSKGVLCSLWSVDDRETANLMVDFYRRLQEGQSAPDALRASQRAMIQSGKAPLYWAPFIVIGE